MENFLNVASGKRIHETDRFFVLKDGYPVSPGHCLIISKLLRLDFFELTLDEKHELTLVIESVKDIIESEYSPDGYNIGMNCGVAAGQSIMHFHCHVIPRYFGDMDDPKGGIRHCIPNKGAY